MKRNEEVTVLIPNYNGLKFLIPCINSLREIEKEEFKILVVDNGSTDGSVKWLQEENIPSLFLDKNYGFAGGVNKGLEKINTRYVILLNNDTVVKKGYVSSLLNAIKKDDKIFAVSPMMISAKNETLIDDAGDGLTLISWGYQRGVGENIKYYEKESEVFSACGGASIYDMHILNKIGYFDEHFFAYLEDLDLSYRARLAGYSIRYEPKSKVVHIGSATSGSRYNDFKVKLSARNNIYLFYKNQYLTQLIINFLPMLLGHFVKLIFFIKKGYAKSYFLGIYEGIKTLHTVKKEVYIQSPNIFIILKIEWTLFVSCFAYIKHFILRRIRK